MAQELGRTPSFAEIVAHIDISPDRTLKALEVANQDISMDTPAFLEENTPVQAILSDTPAEIAENLVQLRMHEVIRESLQCLEKREYHILRDYFGLDNASPLTHEQIGRAMGITREPVRRLRNLAIDKQRACYSAALIDYSRNESSPLAELNYELCSKGSRVKHRCPIRLCNPVCSYANPLRRRSAHQ